MGTIDYIVRVSTAHAATPEECGIYMGGDLSPSQLTARYVLQWLNVIDFLAIVPFYVSAAGGGGGGAAVLRVLRLVRIFRVLKMPKLRACAEMFIDIVIDALPALFLLFFMTMLMCVLYASLIVFAEGSRYSVSEAQFMESHPEGLYIRPTAD